MTSLRETEWIVAEASRVAELLREEYAVVVSGPDVSMAAAVALRLAGFHGRTRRVAIADLVGDAPPLRNALPASDEYEHGISDSFLYGVSLNKIARPLDASGNVFLMPSGSEAVALEAVYRNERWRRLAAGFQQVGALLIVVAVRDVPGYDALCQYVGAQLPIGDSNPAPIADVRTLWVPPPPAAPEQVRKVERAREVATEDRSQRLSRSLATLAAAAAVVFVGLAAWPNLQARFFTESVIAAADSTGSGEGDAAAGMLAEDAVSPIGELPTSASGADAVAFASGGAPLAPTNPQDSLSAAEFAVYFVAANTVEEARPPADESVLSAVAISPVRLGADGTRWFRVTVGAGTDSAQAAALLTRLRSTEQIGANSGSIIRVPFAFQLESGLTPEQSRDALTRWVARGIRAYALRQTDGRVTLFTGAFQNVVQAKLLADSLAGVGIAPVLVYRTGRTF